MEAAVTQAIAQYERIPFVTVRVTVRDTAATDRGDGHGDKRFPLAKLLRHMTRALDAAIVKQWPLAEVGTRGNSSPELCTFRLSDSRVADVLSLSRGVKSELTVYDRTGKWPLTSDNRCIAVNDMVKCVFADPDTWQVYAVVAGKLAVLK